MFWPLPGIDGTSNGFPDLLQWSAENLLLFSSKMLSQFSNSENGECESSKHFLRFVFGYMIFEIIKEKVVHSP